MLCSACTPWHTMSVPLVDARPAPERVVCLDMQLGTSSTDCGRRLAQATSTHHFDVCSNKAVRRLLHSSTRTHSQQDWTTLLLQEGKDSASETEKDERAQSLGEGTKWSIALRCHETVLRYTVLY